jgi:2'-5' RNA ligase
MKLNGTPMPGYRVYEYLLVLNPHEELRQRIMKTKMEFCEKYHVPSGTGSKPYIALVNFLQAAMMEERIVSRLRTITMAHHPFKVELKDFGSFPSHTVFINVTSKLPIQALVKQIRSGSQRLLKLNKENKPYFMGEPHLTIARKLQPGQYEKGWMEYQTRHFTGRFIADSLLLLKRPAGEKGWQIRERFEFMNLPVATRQGELFG